MGTPVTNRTLPIVLGITMIIPAVGSLYRVFDLTSQWDWALKFTATHVDNLPLLIHAISAVTFLILGAFQILPGFRSRNLARHRKLGRIAGVAGLIAALSGVWMTLAHQEISTLPLLYARLLFGTLWAVFILLAIRNVLKKRLPQHRAFMIRAYAIALTAGTLPFIYLPIYLIWGELPPLLDDGVQVIGWIVNLAVAEWIIRRPTRARTPISHLQSA